MPIGSYNVELPAEYDTLRASTALFAPSPTSAISFLIGQGIHQEGGVYLTPLLLAIPSNKNRHDRIAFLF
ncbi:MAG: hypothetical protein R6V83_02780 [Candidatus Thorarchaeota archaeon]